MSAFHLAPLGSTDTALRATIELDARQPYLDDHRPGGDPLFGTVMGIEAMVSAAVMLAPGAQPTRMESVENFEPFILHGGVRPRIDVTATIASRTAAAVAIDTSVVSSPPGSPPVMHFRSRMLAIRTAAAQPLRRAAGLPPNAAKAVTAAQVYAVFFHGPSYRVVGSAHWHDNRLYARLATALPAIFLPPLGAALAAPRLIELALQCAGLFEIAKHGRMMIPHLIARIERFTGMDVDGARTLWAIAETGTASDAPCGGLDVHVVDEDGNVHLRVTGYHTLPLPFAADDAGVLALQASLN